MSNALALQQASVQARGVKVNVFGRLQDLPVECQGSLSSTCRELCTRLKISGPASVQVADSAGTVLHNDQEMAVALREGRHPLQAQLTVVSLREIEQKKYEVETKKEELAQYQWQIVADEMQIVLAQVNAVAANLQAVKDDCQKQVQSYQEAENMRRDQIIAALTRETKEREAGHRDLHAKFDRVLQMMDEEKSARDVADHQLGKQAMQVSSRLDRECSQRAQEIAEIQRQLAAQQHAADVEAQRGSEQWNAHLDSLKQLEARTDDHNNMHTSKNQRLKDLEGLAGKLSTTVASLENAVQAQSRAIQDDIQRRGEELHRTVRDEILSREAHLSRFAKDLETSWQSLEARMQRSREEAANGAVSLGERARVLESRCAELEADFVRERDSQSSKNHAFLDRIDAAVSIADKVEMGMKASDVAVSTMATKVEDLLERVAIAETELQTKAPPDYWQPQMEQFQRGLVKQSEKLAQLEKDTHTRFCMEASHREGTKSQLRDSMKTCLDKIAVTNGPSSKDRFLIVNDEEERGSSLNTQTIPIQFNPLKALPSPNGQVTPRSSSIAAPTAVAVKPPATTVSTMSGYASPRPTMQTVPQAVNFPGHRSTRAISPTVVRTLSAGMAMPTPTRHMG